MYSCLACWPCALDVGETENVTTYSTTVWSSWPDNTSLSDSKTWGLECPHSAHTAPWPLSSDHHSSNHDISYSVASYDNRLSCTYLFSCDPEAECQVT